jgi:hypothetical protein
MSFRVEDIVFDELTSDPGTPGEGQVWFNTTTNQLKGYVDGATRILWPVDAADVSGVFATNIDAGGNDLTNVNLVDGVDVSAHAARHIQGGADEVDGDKLDIDFTPANYTPDTTPAEADHVDQLSAHLAGIDTALGGAGSAGGDLTVSFGNGIKNKDSSYVVEARMIFRGTTVLGTPSNIKGIVEVGDEVGDIRIYDATNSQEIVEVTGITDTTPAINDFGTISNLPAGEALWEIQMRVPLSNKDYMYLYSLEIFF